MSPVIRANWWLSGLAVLLAIASWWCQQNSSPAPPTVTGLLPDQISQVHILRDGKPVAHLEKQEQVWKWLPSGEPLKDQEWLDKILHFAELPSLHHFPVDESRLTDFGLKPPRYTLVLDGQSLELGSLDPASGLRYLRVGSSIHLITDSYTHLLSRKAP
ncbi:hypothetical protein [Thiolapillus brandeum]|uniref:DUF4340 domain-containing protein n=1 Tax=Thiolapillus brandeum TaxID=1076588 RepID=A0A7U6GKA0_9GAMM|nr:hypothetical protein [Thiolapillus brandeum]BAO45227.1 hypothetical protein TBH_C2316 [Thiolapillus brandeum]